MTCSFWSGFRKPTKWFPTLKWRKFPRKKVWGRQRCKWMGCWQRWQLSKLFSSRPRHQNLILAAENPEFPPSLKNSTSAHPLTIIFCMGDQMRLMGKRKVSNLISSIPIPLFLFRRKSPLVNLILLNSNLRKKYKLLNEMGFRKLRLIFQSLHRVDGTDRSEHVDRERSEVDPLLHSLFAAWREEPMLSKTRSDFLKKVYSKSHPVN